MVFNVTASPRYMVNRAGRNTVSSLDLARFEVDPSRGFLPPQDPLVSLPSEFSFLDELGRELPDLLNSGKLRRVIEGLRHVEVDGLRGSELQRARMIYAFLASAYVHATPGGPANRIPASVSVPLYELSGRVGMPPVLSYDVYALNNWRRKDTNGMIVLENLEILQSFVDIPDEPWFILVHIEVEAEAAPALVALGHAEKTVAEDNSETIQNSLEVMASRLWVMKETLSRMYEGNNPDLYFKSFRPYLVSFEGVVYEGVDAFGSQPQSFAGETAAQSSVVPSFDAVLGVKHRPTQLTDYITIMRGYMPRPHRDFIRAIDSPSIRDYVMNSKDRKIVDSYNSCLEALAAFRTEHLGLAETYIHTKVTNPKGTGGTPFMMWLTQLRDETLEHKIS